MKTIIHNHYYCCCKPPIKEGSECGINFVGVFGEIFEKLNLIIQNQKTMSEVLDQLTADLAEAKAAQVVLQASVDTMQSGIDSLLAASAEQIATLETRIAELEALLANGASAAELQPIIDGLKEMKVSIEATKADVESTLSAHNEDPSPEPGA